MNFDDFKKNMRDLYNDSQAKVNGKMQQINPIKIHNNKQNAFSEFIIKMVKHYQKIYKFEMNGGNSHNNEADAFKHAFLSAHIACLKNVPLSNAIGTGHEWQNKNNKQPDNEYEMDMYNNEIGRQIGLDVRKEMKIPPNAKLTTAQTIAVQNRIAEKIMEKMHNGVLITSPNDKRVIDKINKKKSRITGYAADITDNLSDLLKPANRVFYNGEINPAKTKQDEFVIPLLEQFYDNDKKLPSESELQSRVKTGELIYVKDYIRSNGAKVSGYYRHYPED